MDLSNYKKRGVEPTLKQVVDKVNKSFLPDITIKWDERFKMFVIKAENVLGEIWYKQFRALRFQGTKLITHSALDDTLNSIGKIGLTVEVEDREELETNDEIEAIYNNHK